MRSLLDPQVAYKNASLGFHQSSLSCLHLYISVFTTAQPGLSKRPSYVSGDVVRSLHSQMACWVQRHSVQFRAGWPVMGLAPQVLLMPILTSIALKSQMSSLSERLLYSRIAWLNQAFESTIAPVLLVRVLAARSREVLMLAPVVLSAKVYSVIVMAL